MIIPVLLIVERGLCKLLSAINNFHYPCLALSGAAYWRFCTKSVWLISYLIKVDCAVQCTQNTLFKITFMEGSV